MILIKLIFTIFYLNFAHLNNELLLPANDTDLSSVISDICREFFIKKITKFNVIVYGQSSHYFDDVLDETFGSIVGNYTTTVQYIKYMNKWNHKFEDSALILLNDLWQL
jgi:hypothetical protein